jgi:hypothetical protein
MSWLFSQALVEEYLGANCLDGEPSVQSNGKPTKQAYCAPDKMTDFYRVSQFGMMFKPLTESLGEELLMLYQADFHAKTYPQQEGGGIEAERSGMWKEMARIIGEVRPRYAFVENSPMLTFRGLGTVLGDLAKMGFDAEWGVLSAADVGANHKRERIWICAEQRNFLSYPMHNRDRWGQQQQKSIKKTDESISNSSSIRQQGQGKYEQSINSTQDSQRQANYAQSIGRSEFWSVEPKLGRVANGVVARLDRLKAIGNGQVPLCAATAWKLLKERLDG